MRLRRLWLLVLVGYAAVSCAQRPGGFQVLGPGGGGAMFRPTVSPHDPQTVMLTCDMGGSYLTHDGGRSWRNVNLHGSIFSFAFDPTMPGVIYAGGTGLWRSTDNGRTWKLLLPRPSKVTDVMDFDFEGEESILAKEPFADEHGAIPEVTAIALDPLNSKQIYVAMGKLLVSSGDGGASWSAATALPDDPTQLLVGPGTDGRPTLWMSSRNGFWTVGHGTTRIASNDLIVPFRTSGMTLTQGHVVLFASGAAGFFRGVMQPGRKAPAWLQMTLPGSDGKVTAFASSSDGREIFAAYVELKLQRRTWKGIARSTDEGRTWSLMTKNGESSSNVSDEWVTPTFSPYWGEEPSGFSVAAQDARVVYATDEGRTLKSVDGGVHWQQVYARAMGNGAYASTGLDVTAAYGIFFDPFDARRMFLGSADIGLWRSEDGGTSWIYAQKDLLRTAGRSVYSVVLDPTVRGRMWATMAGQNDLPKPRTWHRKPLTSFEGAVAVSKDGGRHWELAGKGLPNTTVTHLLLDPRSPAERRTLYAVSFTYGVYKSTDGGATWQQKSQGLAHNGALSWRISLASDGTLYLVVARESRARDVQHNDTDGALYRSRDGAEHWERVAMPEGVNGPTSLTIDPRNPAKLLLSAWARPVPPHGAGGGVYGSSDGGAHWKPVFQLNQHVWDVTYNPANPSELFLAGYSGSAYHSTDDGAHWKRIPGFNFKAGLEAVADPWHPGQVYITTSGGGVWHGAVDSAPGVEDVVTKEMQLK